MKFKFLVRKYYFVNKFCKIQLQYSVGGNGFDVVTMPVVTVESASVTAGLKETASFVKVRQCMYVRMMDSVSKTYAVQFSYDHDSKNNTHLQEYALNIISQSTLGFLFSELCTCSITSHNWYNLYDGNFLRFAGTCKYTLSRHINPKSDCQYNAEIKYKRTDSPKIGSALEFMEITAFGKKIHLGRNLEVMVWGSSLKNICM